MTIIQLGRKFIEAQIVTETHAGEKVYIQRIVMSPTESAWPFVLKSRHCPTSVSKSQGQSLNKIGLYLHKQVFTMDSYT